MGEIKSVKVDNWGVFFLQKLQNFFNKTDYCDLTLQFNDNSQLKVHRLVLSACTDYFNVLEQTCEMIDDVLIMPNELQADVVVPIVNFMYTGTLEFELRMYGKLLKTAREMNMTVLLKLLEAHRRTMERNPPPQPLNRNLQRNSTTYQRKIASTGTGTSSSSSSSNITQQRRSQTSTPAITTYKSLQIKPVTYYQGGTTVQKYVPSKAVKGPSRFDYPPEGKVLPPETFEQSFDTISYESKPLICKEEPDSEDYESLIQKNSQFEELRRGYNNNKRPASSTSSYESPPEKKPNIEDVKEYAEQQRVRKQIAQEFDDDNEYDETLDDEFHNDDDDDDYVPPPSLQKQVQKTQKKQSPQQKSTTNQQQQQQPIVIKQENNRPTIVVKDTPNSNVNHAKIISEVLRKYPHLVKNNKNIKLKILPKTGAGGKSETQKIVVKKETVEQRPVAVTSLPPSSVKHNTYPSASQRLTPTPAGTSLLQQKSLIQSKVSPPRKYTSGSNTSTISMAATASTSQPRRIDSKTMHSLIAMGAENRTGPWLCLRCGVNGRPISIPSYRGFRRHLINTHGEKIDPRLCEHCGWRSTNNRELYHHMLVEHKIKPPSAYSFPKCELCDAILLSYSDLEKHITESHEEGIEVNQNCIYCNKTFANESMLYAHMKSQHKERAKEDGVIDFSDDDVAFESDSQLSQYQSDGGSEHKIKILSDISLPKNIPVIEAEDNSPGTTITLPPEVIDASNGPRFVNADGKEMELTEEQRQEIISQLDNQEHGAVVMVLNDDTITTTELSGTSISEIQQNDKTKSEAEAPIVEKELHKPRKTKHTVRTDVDDNEEGEEIIEWLDEESGNIMKVPLSKFSKISENENEDEDDEKEETVKETKDKSESLEDKSKETTKTKADESSSVNDKEEQDETSDSIKEKKDDEVDKKKNSEVKTKKINESEDDETKKPESTAAMETLKILTGDWTDEDEGDEQKGDKKKKKSNVEKKDQCKDEEILFETIAVVEEANATSNNADKNEDKNELRKSRSKSRESNKTDVENAKTTAKKSDEKDDNMIDIDTSLTSEEQDVDKLLKDVHDNTVDDVIDDDMKIIEELKNYEAEQLAAEKEKEKLKAKSEERQLRQKSKSKSKSTSPTMSENSNQSGNVSATSVTSSDKPKKRGRPRKSLSLQEQKPKDDEGETAEIVIQKENDEIKEKAVDETEKDEIKKITGTEECSRDSSEEKTEVIENKDKNETKVEEKNNEIENSGASSTDKNDLITKAEIRNLISDWGDDDDDEEL